jgi:hypothetical protein
VAVNRGPAALTCMTIRFSLQGVLASSAIPFESLFSCIAAAIHQLIFLLKTKRNNEEIDASSRLCSSLYFRRERRSDTIKRIIMTIENLFTYCETKKEDAFSLVIQFLKDN